MYNQVLNYLISEPRFRERRFKDRGIVNLLIERHPTLKEIPKETLIDMVKDFDSMNRYWRLVLSEREDLRGFDFNNKREYSEKKQIELGYTPNYYRDLKTLKLL